MRRIALKAFDFSRQLRRSPSNVKRLLATNSAINRAEKLSNEPNNIAAAFVDNDCRKLERICEEITSLNLLQVSALVMRLKTALNIPDEALNAQFITASASASSSTNSNIENSPSDNKELISVFDLTLKSFDPSNKLKLVKYFKDRMSMTLVEAKNFVEKVPQVVMSKISSEEADQMASCLAELGESRNNQGGPNRGKFNNNSPRPGFKPNSGGRFSSGGNAPPSGGAFQRRGSFGGGGRGAPGARGPPKVIVEPHRHAGVFIVRGKADALATKNMRPTQSVYGEKLIEIKDQGIEYRVWNPFRSKLASAIIGGVDEIHIKPGAKVLYLGAASGTTVSHVSDIIGETGRVYAVEFSKRVARDLLNLAQQRSNIVPIIADARKPIEYRMLVSMVDVIFADVAQPDQARIVAVNAEQFLKDSGAVVISIKASCIDSTAQPEAVFANEVNKLREYRIKPKEQITLEPYDRDHVVVIGHYRVKPKN